MTRRIVPRAGRSCLHRPRRQRLRAALGLVCLLATSPALRGAAHAGERSGLPLLAASLSIGSMRESLGGEDASVLCNEAIRLAELRHRLPAGLLLAIGRAESGRLDPVTHRLEPWPWAVQAQDQSLYFGSKAKAVQWVEAARARGIVSIDTGCLQVNLLFHPHAFGTMDAAFDPRGNADYAARFLVQLHATTQDWEQAIGFYHSRTTALADTYRRRVRQVMNRPAVAKQAAALGQLSDAWRATLRSSESEAARPAGNSWETLLHWQSRATPSLLSAHWPSRPMSGIR
jgi:hypothetical protein